MPIIILTFTTKMKTVTFSLLVCGEWDQTDKLPSGFLCRQHVSNILISSALKRVQV